MMENQVSEESQITMNQRGTVTVEDNSSEAKKKESRRIKKEQNTPKIQIV